MMCLSSSGITFNFWHPMLLIELVSIINSISVSARDYMVYHKKLNMKQKKESKVEFKKGLPHSVSGRTWREFSLMRMPLFKATRVLLKTKLFQGFSFPIAKSIGLVPSTTTTDLLFYFINLFWQPSSMQV